MLRMQELSIARCRRQGFTPPDADVIPRRMLLCFISTLAAVAERSLDTGRRLSLAQVDDEFIRRFRAIAAFDDMAARVTAPPRQLRRYQQAAGRDDNISPMPFPLVLAVVRNVDMTAWLIPRTAGLTPESAGRLTSRRYASFDQVISRFRALLSDGRYSSFPSDFAAYLHRRATAQPPSSDGDGEMTAFGAAYMHSNSLKKCGAGRFQSPRDDARPARSRCRRPMMRRATAALQRLPENFARFRGHSPSPRLYDLRRRPGLTRRDWLMVVAVSSRAANKIPPRRLIAHDREPHAAERAPDSRRSTAGTAMPMAARHADLAPAPPMCYRHMHFPRLKHA